MLHGEGPFEAAMLSGTHKSTMGIAAETADTRGLGFVRGLCFQGVATATIWVVFVAVFVAVKIKAAEATL